MIKSLLRIFSCLCCLILFSCDNDSVMENKLIKKTLILGITPTFPPFEFINDKKIKGFDIDLINIIARRLGYEIQIKTYDFIDLIPALTSGNVDLVISLTATPERQQIIDFSSQYYTPSFAMLYRKDKPITKYGEINNNVIGVLVGSTMESFLKLQKDSGQIPMVNIIPITHEIAAIQELKLGRLDGVFLEEAQAKVYANRYANMTYTLFLGVENGYAIAFPKNSPLCEQFNNVLISLRDSGELDSLKEKWLF